MLKKLTLAICFLIFTITNISFVTTKVVKFGLPSWATPQLFDSNTADVYSVSPPGNNGFVASKSPSTPINATDELSMYSNLIYNQNSLNASNISHFYHQETIGISPKDVVAIEHPNQSENVYIYRDKYDIPYIFAKDNDSLAWGAGYAAAEDKLFSMDVLRHLGSGTLAAFAGASCSFEQMDYYQITERIYDKNEADEMINNLASYTKGKMLLSMIKSYINGINFYINQAINNPALMPEEYKLLGIVPQAWTKADVISVLMVVSAQDGQGGGGEIYNADLLNYLKTIMPINAADQVFNDIREQNDPLTPVTVNKKYPYMLVPLKTDSSLNALVASSQLGPAFIETSQACADSPGTKVGNEILQIVSGAKLFSSLTSNAILIGKQLSKTGSPLAVFGPQIGYFAPSVFEEEYLHSPDINAAGVSLAGMNFVILFGRSLKFAWSATSSGADDQDEEVAFLCNSNSTEGYEYDGKCVSISHHQLIENVGPTIAAVGAAASTLTYNLNYIKGATVDYFGTYQNKPVAVIEKRASNFKEETALLNVFSYMQPDVVNSPQSFINKSALNPWALNWYYIDSQNIAYYSGGLLPLRSKLVNPNFPVIVSSKTEWTGYLKEVDHPQEINPKSGIIINWNNASAINFSAADDDYSHGPVYRSQLLSDAINAELKAHHFKLTKYEVISAMEQAATTDMTAKYLIPDFVKIVSNSGNSKVKEIITLLRNWANNGFKRITSSAQNKVYEYQSSILVWDQLYPQLILSVFGPIFSGSQIQYYDGLAMAFGSVNLDFDATPNGYGAHQGDSYGGGWEGFLWKAFMAIEHTKIKDQFSSAMLKRICSGLNDCKTQFINDIINTFNQMSELNPNEAPSNWSENTVTKTAGVSLYQYDEIQFTATGIIGVPTISMPWQNRPTYQQVVAFSPQKSSMNYVLPVVILIATVIALIVLVFALRSRKRTPT
jgi:acyl-homoserine lactone acylase PvdQ